MFGFKSKKDRKLDRMEKMTAGLIRTTQEQHKEIEMLSHDGDASFGRDIRSIEELFANFDRAEHFQDRANESERAFIINGLPNRAITMTTSSIVRKKLSIQSKNDDIQNIINNITAHPFNCWFARMKEALHRLKVDGEVYWFCRFNKQTGEVLVFEVPPRNVKRIAYDNPKTFWNKCWPSRFRIKWEWEEYDDSLEPRQMFDERTFEQFKENEDGMIEFIVMVRNPTLSDLPRGIGTVYPSLFWLRLYKKFANGIVQRGMNYANMLWHVVVGSESEESVSEVRDRVRPINKPTVKVTGPDEEWKIIAPPSNIGSGSKDDLKEVKRQAVASYQTDEGTATGDNSNNNFASSKVGMRQQKVQRESDQVLFEWFLRSFFGAVIWLSVGSGILKSKIPLGGDETDTEDVDMVAPNDQPHWFNIMQTFQIKFPDPLGEDAEEQKIRADTLISIGASQQTKWEEIGLDPKEELRRLKQERGREREILKEEGENDNEDIGLRNPERG